MRRRLQRQRRVREALLLDLGMLVYELHRRGKRAPELLQRKAAELTSVDDELRGLEETRGESPERDAAEPTSEAERPHLSACPRCGEAAERGQLVCLGCGSRMRLDRRRSRVLLAALAIPLAVVALGGGAFGLALSEITSDSDPEVAAADRPEQPAPSATPGEPQAPSQARDTKTSRPTETTPDDREQPRHSLLLDWPNGVTAYTVVLVTTGNRPAARRVAREAVGSGLDAGLLRSDDYDLGSNLWIVFAGRFHGRERAERQAADLGEHYPGAYAQLLRRAG